MKFKYLVIYHDMIYGKAEINKQYFVNAVTRGDTIIDLENMTQFDKETNSWKPIEGDS